MKINIPRFAFGSAIVFGILLYWFGATSGNMKFPEIPLKHHLMGQVAQGLMLRQSHLPLEPHPDILSLPNPYEFSTRKPLNDRYPWDILLYKGKYYAYWGVGPIVSFYIPWKLVTGRYPNDLLPILLFSLGSVWMLYLIFTCVSPDQERSISEKIFLFLIFTFASAISVSMPHGYMVFITAGLFYCLLGIHLTIKAAANPQSVWLPAISGIFFAFAVLCRITFLAYAVAAALWYSREILLSPKDRTPGRYSAFVCPIFISLVAIFTYNYVRFDSISEFGVRYQLGLMDHNVVPFNSLRLDHLRERIPLHLWYDLFYPPRFSLRFPLIHLEQTYDVLNHIPATFKSFGRDPVNGIFTLCPLIILAVFLTPTYLIRSAKN
jgi:hypothetical protein